MKKVIASDYDGTIFIDGQVQAEVIEGIKRFRAVGHLFGLVTGRDIRMTKEALDEHQIPFDFLICNNGCVTYDENYQEIKSSYLPEAIVKQLIVDPLIARSSYIVLADQDGRYVYDNAYQAGKYTSVYHTQCLTEKDLATERHFHQMDTRYKDAKEMLEVAEQLREKYSHSIEINPNITTIDMTPKGVTKLTGLKAYIDSLQEDVKVLPIGDGLNDLGMIAYYKGYTMPWAVDVIKKEASLVVASLAELIALEL